MTRIVSGALVLAACGSHGTPDAPPAPKVVAAIDGGVVVAHTVDAGAPAPAVAIFVGANGLAIAPTGGSWDVRHLVTTPVASPAELARAVLGAEVAAGGAGAARAKQWISALDEAAPPELGEVSGDLEISMTYLAPVAQLADPTPLVIVTPGASAALLVETLDAVGGEIAVDDGKALRVLDLGAPWTNPGYGGVDVDEDRPSVDVTVGVGKLFIGGDFGPGRVIDPDAAALAPFLRGTETATIDLLITAGTSVADVLAAIAAAPDRTIGVGITPERFPTLGMDGQPQTGPIGHYGALRLHVGEVVTADHDYAAIAKRYLMRASSQFLACGGLGTEKISFDVDALGKVVKPHATECVAHVLSSLTLPLPPGGHATIATTLEHP